MMSLSSIFLPSGVNFESKASVYDLICCQTTAVETKPPVSTSGAPWNYTDTEKLGQTGWVTRIVLWGTLPQPHQIRKKKISFATTSARQPAPVIVETDENIFASYDWKILITPKTGENAKLLSVVTDHLIKKPKCEEIRLKAKRLLFLLENYSLLAKVGDLHIT